MRQPTTQRFEVAGVLLQSLQDVREAAGEVAKLVGSIGATDRAGHPSVRVDGVFGFVAQPPDSHREPRGEHQQPDGADGVDDDQRSEQFFEGPVAQREHVVRRFLDQHGAHHLVLEVDGLRGREDDRARIRSQAPPRTGLSCQRVIDFTAFEPIGAGCDVLEVLIRFRHGQFEDRLDQQIGPGFPQTRDRVLVGIGLYRRCPQ